MNLSESTDGLFLGASEPYANIRRANEGADFQLTCAGRMPILNRMVNYHAGELDSTFSALADPTRRAILARLAQGETSVSELAVPHRMSLPAVSKHLRVLERAGLLTRTKSGRVHRCQIAAVPMRNAAAWIEHYRRFWEAQLDSLQKFLGEAIKQEEQNASSRPAKRKRGDRRSQ